MKLFYQYMTIFFNFSPTSTHFHPLQVENCDSNSRLVVDEDENGKFRLTLRTLMSTTVDILRFIRNYIIPDNQLLISKYAFNLETLIYAGT